MFKQQYYTRYARKDALFGFGYGAVDMGIKLAVFRYFTEGVPNSEDFNAHNWRLPIPIFFAGLFTCWMKSPFEIGFKAYHAD